MTFIRAKRKSNRTVVHEIMMSADDKILFEVVSDILQQKMDKVLNNSNNHKKCARAMERYYLFLSDKERQDKEIKKYKLKVRCYYSVYWINALINIYCERALQMLPVFVLLYVGNLNIALVVSLLVMIIWSYYLDREGKKLIIERFGEEYEYLYTTFIFKRTVISEVLKTQLFFFVLVVVVYIF